MIKELLDKVLNIARLRPEASVPPAPEKTMNIKKLRRLRDFLAERVDDAEFNMARFGNCALDAGGAPSCGTAGCIAGWAVAMYAPGTSFINAGDRAQDIFGLNDKQAFYLFGALMPSLYLTWVTRQEAIDALDHLIATGMPRWPTMLMAAFDRVHVVRGRNARLMEMNS